ncbi:L,D-transpeptidase [Xinfangfangia sp. CPCC 101601]|uniref:L,D-transpeptidase n=1 Tax=Pseudogemmobacter lacusdianii TaxID=3069608 RepID=A0ABU0VZ58_9RHOB|nr:L,D-transpeptidase [Xinfangfangia sp. CPCC 101601]MDQ2067007.1 L,D-transpeptidase [Xinfangfangia sp. CPCC 101601]
MTLTGRIPALSPLLKAPLLALAAALTLSACVDGMSGTAPGASVAQLPGPPLPKPDDALYAAQSDGQFSVPELPIDQIPEAYRRQVVEYPSDQVPGTIIIHPSQRVLYYVLGKNKAIRYGIAVGAEGFGWSGESIVSKKRHWPTWTPPKEMIERKPSLQKWENGQPGGPTNPMGARAIYLTSNGVDYGYRIHGTPEWKSIGRNASSGCFRMINQDVMDLYERVQGGEKVIVLTAKGEMPTKLSIPKPPAPKKKAEPKPEVPATDLTLTGPPPGLVGPTAPATGAEAAPAVAVPALPTAAPAVSSAASPIAADTPPTAEPVAPAAPAAPAAVEAPAVIEAPAEAPAPAATCAVPLVNGLCPQG